MAAVVSWFDVSSAATRTVTGTWAPIAGSTRSFEAVPESSIVSAATVHVWVLGTCQRPSLVPFHGPAVVRKILILRKILIEDSLGPIRHWSNIVSSIRQCLHLFNESLLGGYWLG